MIKAAFSLDQKRDKACNVPFFISLILLGFLESGELFQTIRQQLLPPAADPYRV